MMESDAFDTVLDEKLAALGQAPAFAPMMAMGMQPAQLKPLVKPFVLDLGLDLAPLVLGNVRDPAKIVEIATVRSEIQKYMNVRLRYLTEERVTRLLEFVIRSHLGWLVVWGNVFGAAIGLMAQIIGLNPDYRPT